MEDMSRTERTSRHLFARAGVGCALAAVAVLGAAPADAHGQASPPMLRITVDNGRTTAEVGDKLSYTISVENMGAAPVSDLRVTQTMPEGLTLESADGGGAARKGLVVWSVDLASGGTQALHTTMALGTTPDQVLRMASVACAALSSKVAPLVCATHSDELPAGVAAAAAVPSNPGTDHAGSARFSTAEYAGFGGVLVLLLALGGLAVRRRLRL